MGVLIESECPLPLPMNLDSGTRPSGCRTTGISTRCSLKAAFLSPIRFLVPMRGKKPWRLSEFMDCEQVRTDDGGHRPGDGRWGEVAQRSSARGISGQRII